MNFKLIKENSSVKIDIDPVELLLFVTNKNIMKSQPLKIYDIETLLLSYFENIPFNLLQPVNEITFKKIGPYSIFYPDLILDQKSFFNLFFKYKDFELKLEDCDPAVFFTSEKYKRITSLYKVMFDASYNVFVSPFVIRDNFDKLFLKNFDAKKFDNVNLPEKFEIAMLPTKIFFPELYDIVKERFNEIIIKESLT
ncbi:MAG: hypothetical protein QXW35_05120 [Candidatus Aenigmatarchaeota archaeon]